MIDFYMKKALDLALKARGNTFPNPLVGAVVVRNSKIVGMGYHKKAGGPHAEIFALRQAGRLARGASLFCTFEPCAHFGRTGPCAVEIIKAGIKNVYIGMVDPNPATKGKGVKLLRQNGIAVKVGFLNKEIASINRPFIKAHSCGLPFVTIKIAQSLDGKVATSKGESKWITSKESRQYSHGLRRYFDGIIVGINTVLKDDPGLEAPVVSSGHRLFKIIVDSDLKIPLNSRLLNTRQPVIVAATNRSKAKERKLRQRGVNVVYTKSKDNKVSLLELMRILNSLEVRNLLVEGGPGLIGSFLDERLADRANIYIAPIFIGSRDSLSSVGGHGAVSLALAAKLKNTSSINFKEDIFIEGDLEYK